MAEPLVLKRIRLNCSHQPTGKTRHYSEGALLPCPFELQIARYEDAPGFYRLYFVGNGNEMTDTYHETAERAMNQAEWEFQVEPHEWETVE